MAQLAIAHIGYAQELRARYPYALVSWQIWFYVVFEVREVLHPTRRWRKWFPRQRFRILFRRINVYYAIHAVNSYAKSPQCRNADFKLAVALLFHQ
ncbi:hypothetical protein [Chitinophaga costaii]|nr:hypothetical protein [Chitinophaga costaii]